MRHGAGHDGDPRNLGHADTGLDRRVRLGAARSLPVGTVRPTEMLVVGARASRHAAGRRLRRSRTRPATAGRADRRGRRSRGRAGGDRPPRRRRSPLCAHSSSTCSVRRIGGAPPAIWSAGAPGEARARARDRRPRNERRAASSRGRRPSLEASHGGGAAQSRGGLRWTGSSPRDPMTASSSSRGLSGSVARPGRPARRRSRGGSALRRRLGLLDVAAGSRRSGVPSATRRCRCRRPRRRLRSSRRRPRSRPRHRRRRLVTRRRARSGLRGARRAPAPPRAAPSPGTSGRPGTRSTGSTPPGGRAPAAPAAAPRSSDGDDPGRRRARRDRPRRRRRDRPWRRPRWAVRVPSRPDDTGPISPRRPVGAASRRRRSDRAAGGRHGGRTSCPADPQHDRVARRRAELLEDAELEQARVPVEQPAGVRQRPQGRLLAARPLERRLAFPAGRDDPRRTPASAPREPSRRGRRRRAARRRSGRSRSRRTSPTAGPISARERRGCRPRSGRRSRRAARREGPRRARQASSGRWSARRPGRRRRSEPSG